jgi:hypothetical protein
MSPKRIPYVDLEEDDENVINDEDSNGKIQIEAAGANDLVQGDNLDANASEEQGVVANEQGDVGDEPEDIEVDMLEPLIILEEPVIIPNSVVMNDFSYDDIADDVNNFYENSNQNENAIQNEVAARHGFIRPLSETNLLQRYFPQVNLRD